MTQQNAYPRFEAKEWNAAGATQFYGRERKRSYIVEVTLSEEVRGNLLHAGAAAIMTQAIARENDIREVIN